METPYHDVKAAFDEGAQTYDALRRKLIPCFEDFYGTVGKVLPFAAGEQIRVLDLGTGTGLLAGTLLERFPGARVVATDISQEMLAVARERLAGHAVEFTVADYAHAVLPGQFDAIVSALSIHHLTDDDKASLFRRAYQALNPGGVFVNADEVKGPSPELEVLYWEMWEKEVREAGVDTREILAASDRMRHDLPATLDAQLQWLREAGFEDTDCYYKYFAFTVFGGRKPA